MKRRKIIYFSDKCWRKVKTYCIRCGKRKGRVILLRGNKTFFSLCEDCCFLLNFDGVFLGVRKKDFVKTVMKSVLDDLNRYSWHIYAEEDKIDVSKILKILGFEKHEIDDYLPEVVAERL